MMESIFNKFNLHKIWIETNGKSGEKLIFDEIDLKSINISNYNFSQSSFLLCDFSNSKLTNINFGSANLSSSIFCNGYLTDCNFYKADLGYVNFSDSIIKNTKFSKVDFFESVFKDVDIENCNLVNTNFYSTDFSNGKINNVDISMSVFEDVLLDNISLKNIRGIDEANFLSINIGTIETPIILKNEEAKNWFKSKIIAIWKNDIIRNFRKIYLVFRRKRQSSYTKPKNQTKNPQNNENVVIWKRVKKWEDKEKLIQRNLKSMQ